MKAMWKFTRPLAEITAGVPFEFEMPTGATFRAVQNQHEHLALWFEVDPSKPTATRGFVAVETGMNLPGNTPVYRGTAQFVQGRYVLHVYEL